MDKTLPELTPDNLNQWLAHLLLTKCRQVAFKEVFDQCIGAGYSRQDVTAALEPLWMNPQAQSDLVASASKPVSTTSWPWK